jgi:hypothetical protein
MDEIECAVPRHSVLRVLLVIWLVIYTVTTMFVVIPIASIFVLEGFSLTDTRLAHFGIVGASLLLLIWWPASAIIGWVMLAKCRLSNALIVTAGGGGALILIWLGFALLVTFTGG